METKEKVYMSNQLVCMLPPLACKVFAYILNWQNSDSIRYYAKQYSKMMHLSEREVEVAIQTLVDNKLLEIGRIDQTWLLNINKEVVKKYFNVPMQTIHDHEGLKLSTNITWNKTQQELKSSAVEVEDMSEEQLSKLLQRVQVMLAEKQETKKLVKMACAASSESSTDDLPF